jgi:ribonuclease D
MRTVALALKQPPSHNRKVMPPHLLTTQAEVDALAERLKREPEVAFDTEFHSERTYVPRLMLVQLATREETWLLDPLAQVNLGAVWAVLARPDCRLVGHALKNDLRITWQLFRFLPEQAWDTQLAASFLGYGMQAGLGGLLQQTLGVHQPKGDQLADWSQRPLPDRLRSYAAGDVAHLLRLYDQQREALSKHRRLPWLESECRDLVDPARYERDPAEAWRRVAGGKRMEPREGGVLVALAAERERLAAEEDLIPHFLVADDVLLALARSAPRSRRELETDRRFQQRAVQRHAERWLEAIARGLDAPMPRSPARPPPSPELEAVAHLAALLVAEIAAEHDLVPQLLLKRDEVLEGLRAQPRSAVELAVACALEGWRAELVAGPLWQLLTGELLAAVVRDRREPRVTFRPRPTSA